MVRDANPRAAGRSCSSCLACVTSTESLDRSVMNGSTKPQPRMRAMPAAMTVTAASLCLLLAAVRTAASDDARTAPAEATPLELRFRETVHPFLQTYCLECHDAQKRKGDLDLSAFSNLEAVARDHAEWEIVREQLELGAMPPAKAKRRPRADVRQAVIA